MFMKPVLIIHEGGPNTGSTDLHKLKSDEVWNFYSGDPVNLLFLHPRGSLTVEL
jgi:predicted cupin superfamily sugar epimerase